MTASIRVQFPERADKSMKHMELGGTRFMIYKIW